MRRCSGKGRTNIFRFKYILQKIIEYAFILLIVITINFLLIHYMPGEPLVHILGEEDYYYLLYSYPDKLDDLKQAYGLAKPLTDQYLAYIGNIAVLNFGASFISKQSVFSIVASHLQRTLILVVPAIIISGILGLAAGAYAGWKKNSKINVVFSVLSMLLYTIPAYCVAIILLVAFSFHGGFFPVGGMRSGLTTGMGSIADIIWHMVLPVSVLILYRTVYNFFIVKSSIEGIKNEDYILTAYGKGLSEKEVIYSHGLRNAILPYITVICLQFGHAAAGTMLLEVVFSWNGMGTLIYQSVMTKDIPVLQGSFILLSVCIMAFSFLADLLYACFDPRVKGNWQYG